MGWALVPGPEAVSTPAPAEVLGRPTMAVPRPVEWAGVFCPSVPYLCVAERWT